MHRVLALALSLSLHSSAQQGEAVSGRQGAHGNALPQVTFDLQVRRPFEAGIHTALTHGSWAAYREGREWLIFEPGQLEGRGARAVSLPETDKQAASSLTRDYLYKNRGRELWRKPLKGGEWALWWTVPRAFNGFHVIDDERVVLVWTEGSQKKRLPFPYVEFDPGAANEEEQCLLEDWDVDRERLLRRVPLPPEIDGLRAFRGHPQHALGTVHAFCADNHVLVYLPCFGLLYDYRLDRHAMARLDAPWKAVELDWVRRGIERMPGAPGYQATTTFCPWPMSVTPQEDGGLVFAWFETVPNEATYSAILQRMARILPVRMILPAHPEKGGEADVTRFRAARWTPGSTSLKDVRTSGPKDPNDKANPETLKESNHFERRGVFVSGEGEAQPLDRVLARLRAAADRNAKAMAAEQAAKAEDLAGGKRPR